MWTGYFDPQIGMGLDAGGDDGQAALPTAVTQLGGFNRTFDIFKFGRDDLKRSAIPATQHDQAFGFVGGARGKLDLLRHNLDDGFHGSDDWNTHGAGRKVELDLSGETPRLQFIRCGKFDFPVALNLLL